MPLFPSNAAILRLLERLLIPGAVITLLLLAAGLYLALVASPPDYQQGEAVRMMYVHVPAAWMAVLVYGVMASLGASLLIWKNSLAGEMARAAAPLGAGFTAICLLTGMAWGKPMWGAWWVWDARLTSVLILFFFYVGYIALYRTIEDRERAGKACAILALIGLINLPIIKFSVEWWNTLHQPASILRSGGVSIAPAMLWPLFTMALAFLCGFITLLALRTHTVFLQRKQARRSK